jgi:hypothetical protein
VEFAEKEMTDGVLPSVISFAFSESVAGFEHLYRFAWA